MSCRVVCKGCSASDVLDRTRGQLVSSCSNKTATVIYFGSKTTLGKTDCCHAKCSVLMSSPTIVTWNFNLSKKKESEPRVFFMNVFFPRDEWKPRKARDHSAVAFRFDVTNHGVLTPFCLNHHSLIVFSRIWLMTSQIRSYCKKNLTNIAKRRMVLKIVHMANLSCYPLYPFLMKQVLHSE